jgi:predicted TIM-barrel fold metal-dependent hydrolase
MSRAAKVDMHIHIYPAAEIGLADKAYQIWEYGTWPRVRFSDCAGTLPELLDSMSPSGVSKGVVLIYFMGRIKRLAGLAKLGDAASSEARAALDADLLRELEAGNRWGCEVSRAHPELTTYVTVDLNLQPPEAAAAHVKDMAERHGARGLKLHGSMQGFSMADQRLWPTYALCERLGLPVLGHAGPDRDGQGYAEPRAFEPMLGAFPKLKVVLAHLGGAAWRQSAGVAGRHPNAFFDCSEIIHWPGSPKAPTDVELASLIREIGPERVMMGSDFPWYDLASTVERVLALPVLSTSEKEAVLGANALRILGL